MEESHKGMGRLVTVIAAAHCRQQKSMGNHDIRTVRQSATTTPGRHGNWVSSFCGFLFEFVESKRTSGWLWLLLVRVVECCIAMVFFCGCLTGQVYDCLFGIALLRVSNSTLSVICALVDRPWVSYSGGLARRISDQLHSFVCRCPVQSRRKSYATLQHAVNTRSTAEVIGFKVQLTP